MKKAIVFAVLVVSLLAQGFLVSKNVEAQVINDFVAPAGGENWQVGTIHRIYWTGRPSGERAIELFYQKSDGTGKTSIVYKSDTSYGSGNDQLWYDWTVPSSLAPGSYKVVAESVRSGSVYRTSISNSFNITAMTPAGASGDFAVASPAGGEEWQVGRTYIIRWTPPTSFPADIVNIYLVGGGFITSGSPSALNGSYSWTVPSGMSPGFYQIGVRYVRQADERERTSGGSVFGRSGSFRVVSSGDGGDPGQTETAIFLLPAGGEVWQQGQTKVLRWNTPASWPVNEVTLALADPNGNYLRGIAIVKNNVPDSILGGGDFNWIIPTSVASGTYKIKATVNRGDTSTPNVILSNQFTIGDSIPGGGTNQPPVISRIDGPTNLNVGQGGSWTVAATDPNGDALTYEATWGDGSAAPAGTASVLTHTFTVAGTYSLMFRVKDVGGLSAQYPLSVAVSTSGGGGGPVAVGSIVGVTSNLNFRGTPSLSGTPLGVIPKGFAGVIEDGPVVADGYTWWKFRNKHGSGCGTQCPGTYGWSVGDYLTLVTWDYGPGGTFGWRPQGGGDSFPYKYYLSLSTPPGLQEREVWDSAITDSIKNYTFPFSYSLLTDGKWYWKTDNTDIAPFSWNTYLLYRRGTPNEPPTIVSFTGPTSTFTNVPGAWRFQATDPEGALVSYKVDWGDGSAATPVTISGTSVTQELSHTYAQTGSFNIKLTVTDGGGLVAEAALPIQVAAPCSTKFQVGARVKVANDAENGLNVRAVPGGTLLGNQQKNAQGIVVGGPQGQGNYCWWNVNFNTGADGWSAENWLEVSDGGGGQGSSAGVTIISPAAGDIWNIGDPIVIRWTAPTVVTRVHIYLAGVGLIASNIPNTGSYSWVVPSILNGRALGGSILAITVYAADPNVVYFGTSGQFTVGTGGPQPVSGGLSCANPIFLRQDVVMTSAGMNVRATPGISNNVVGQQPLGSRGTVIADSQCDSGSTYRWWSVNFDLGPDGWVVQDYLTLVNRPGGTVPNQPPVLGELIGPTNITVNLLGSWQILALNVDNPSLSLIYTVNWGDGTPSSTYTGTDGQWISISHTYTSTGSKTIQVTVLDGQLSDTENFSVNVWGVAGPNRPPVLDPFTAPNQATVNVNTTWQAKAVDPDGTALDYTFNWGDGMPVSTFTNIASGQSVPAQHTFTQTGSRTITVTASDGQLTDSETMMVNVATEGGSMQGPSSQISGPQTAILGVASVWQIVASDPNSSSINFAVNWGDGTSNNYTSNVGVAKMIDHKYNLVGQKVITVVATNSAGLTHSSSLGVNVTAPDYASAKPSVSPFVGPTQVIIGANTSWTVTLRDSDTNSLTYTLNWNDGTPIVNGTATNGVPFTISHVYQTFFTGYKSVVIIVSDGNSTDSGMVNITSKLPNQSPTADNISGPVDVKAGVGKIWAITGTDPEGAVLGYNFNWGDGVNSNYTNKASGVRFFVDHTYAQPGNYTIQVTVTDNGGLSITKSYSVRINKFAVNDRVEVLPGNTLAVRATPSPTGTWIAGMKPMNQFGTTGTVLEGPVVAGGYTWWKVAWDYSVTGWSAENWLRIYSASSVTTVTIKVGQYAPLVNHPDLPPKGGVGSNDAYYKSISPLTISGRVWTWVSASALWKMTSGPDLTIQY